MKKQKFISPGIYYVENSISFIFRCDDCGKFYKNESEYLVHKRMHKLKNIIKNI